MWIGIAWLAPKYGEIARANDAPVRIQSGFFPEEITSGPQMDLRHIELVPSDALVRLSVNAWYSCAVLPCRWIELIPRGEKSRALRLSHEAHFRELLAIWGTFVRHWYWKSTYTRCLAINHPFSGWLTFHVSNFKSEKIFMPPL